MGSIATISLGRYYRGLYRGSIYSGKETWQDKKKKKEKKDS